MCVYFSINLVKVRKDYLRIKLKRLTIWTQRTFNLSVSQCTKKLYAVFEGSTGAW